jgi:hypothetical protein
MVDNVVGVDENHPEKEKQDRQHIKITAVFEKFLHTYRSYAVIKLQKWCKKKTARSIGLSIVKKTEFFISICP